MSQIRIVGMTLAMIVVASAQEPPATARAKVGADPYTQNDKTALKKVGYESLGPFAFGTGHDTRAIAELLGTEPILWIETAHFRLGCSLPRLPLRHDELWCDEWVAGVRAELKQLGKRLPRVKPDAKELDPWLRAHLMAQRLENLYSRLLQDLGLTDPHFPVAPDDSSAPERFRGLGPHFGMTEKFTVLLVQKAASHARYTRAFQGREMADPVRFQDVTFGCLYWGASEETANGLFGFDYALHAHLIFNVTHNLLTGYRGFRHDLPPWLVTGLAHWHSRAVTPRFPTFDRKDASDKEMRSAFWEWDKRVRGLVRNNAFEPVPALLERTSAGGFDLEQHMQSWALVDFLMATNRPKLMQFVHRMKDPFHSGKKTPSDAEFRLRQTDALQTTLGFDGRALEAAWRQHVLGNKGRK